MHNTRKITDDIIWVGATDRQVQLFENLFPLAHGMSYNSYVLLDEKTALLDTVDSSISDIYMENILHALGGRELDYLIIHHMEPDHCANIEAVLRRFPDVKLVGNKTTFKFLEQFYDVHVKDNYHPVKGGDTLELGKRTLKFIMAPNVHWPEVMFSYDISDGFLFSADGFGSFSPLDGNLFSDELDFDGRIKEESRRYFVNIIGKFGSNVLKVLKKLNGLPINMILPLHGPIFRDKEHISYMIDRYRQWASYEPEQESVLILFGSMYGNTENAVGNLATMLAEKGVKNLRLYDISNTDPSLLMSEMWSYSHIVLASPNYNGDLMYKMDTVIREALRLNLQNRKISFMTNATWGGAALKTMESYFEDPKHFEIVGEPVKISSSVKVDNVPEIEALADAIVASLNA
ncbi:FprA family A-type flavoprotein [Vagococcus elongatus]|uniref:Flavodoxin n=1 Tax=Vagococcus elongatus TaxID=180344 RepID=A0A430ATZ4_9ENTE|nr:FprA family A-type flavoprotein [Vagococcus elongatus]RSU11528.1 flavodoxin [Vagococcus elongatus]